MKTCKYLIASECHTKPSLAIISVGEDQASAVYVRQKEKLCDDIGITCTHLHICDDNITTEDVIKVVHACNECNYSGIIVQLPLPSNLDQRKIVNEIDPLRDVDCLTDINMGRLYSGNQYLTPCTPTGIIDYCLNNNISLCGKRVTVIGRSNIVGRPVAALFEQHNATVTLCHSHTSRYDLEKACWGADIIVCAVGKENFLNISLVSSGTLVFDVGINRGEDGKLHGDVSAVTHNCSSIHVTPVPGGVGILTVAELCLNVIKACIEQERNGEL